MKTFFTSDLHFGHANIIKYCNRPFEDVREMDRQLISNFNQRVGHDDTTIFLGDLFFCNLSRAKEIMHRLNGKKELVLGNHDKLIRNEPELQKLFHVIHPDLYTKTIDGIQVTMCHYPLLTWHRAHRGSFMLHGHSHGTIPFDPKYRRLDVGVDPSGYAPMLWQEIKKKLEAVDPNDVRDY